MEGSGSFLKKRLAARKPKNFFDSGAWALAGPTPQAQSNKGFCAAFFKKRHLF
jgi:hypothetical protein